MHIVFECAGRMWRTFGPWDIGRYGEGTASPECEFVALDGLPVTKEEHDAVDMHFSKVYDNQLAATALYKLAVAEVQLSRIHNAPQWVRDMLNDVVLSKYDDKYKF